MIKYVPYNEIDFIAYDKCIKEARNSLVYGLSWYLDIVTENWDVLVLDNYSAVMPLPRKEKFCIDYIYVPPWIQQLGVFSKINTNNELIASFLNAIPSKFKLVDMMLNFENHTFENNVSMKNNFVLKLNKPYDTLFKVYNSSRKKSLKRAQKLEMTINQSHETKELINLFKKNKGYEIQRPHQDYELLEKLIVAANNKNMVEILIVKNKTGELMAGSIFIVFNKRIIYLFSAINAEGRTNQANTFILDTIIQKYCDSEMILDFEGSMIEGAKEFFKSFGSRPQNYSWYQKRRFVL